MSLNWDLSRIEDYEDYCWQVDPDRADGQKLLNIVTHAMIYATMATGIGELTERAAPEFYTRLRAWELINGPMIIETDGPRPITWAEVKRHVGLSTNVFPRETDAQFARKLMTSARDRARYIMERADAAE